MEITAAMFSSVQLRTCASWICFHLLCEAQEKHCFSFFVMYNCYFRYFVFVCDWCLCFVNISMCSMQKIQRSVKSSWNNYWSLLGASIFDHFHKCSCPPEYFVAWISEHAIWNRKNRASAFKQNNHFILAACILFYYHLNVGEFNQKAKFWTKFHIIFKKVIKI